MPVLLLTDRIGVDAEGSKLWLLAQASLELRETREACQPDHMVPQLGGRIFVWQPEQAKYGMSQTGL